MKYVPDTSVIVNGLFSEFISKKKANEIIIPETLVCEIEHQANAGKAIGFKGLEELKKLQSLYEVEFTGTRPQRWQIEKAKSGELDEIIRQIAIESKATFVTADRVQKEIAEIKGLKTIFLEEKKVRTIKIEDFFSENIMSVHIKSDILPYGKKGKPGDFELIELSDKPMKNEELEDLAEDILERARQDKDSFIEMDLRGANIVQLREYRIAITKPPFSDKMEITAIRPIVFLKLEDYKISEKLEKRMINESNGILVSGSPGAGKSTFVEALAEKYKTNKKIVKTMEKPRDLILSDEITQYTALEGSMEKTGNILLLVRPDYTIFDEMRNTSDFRVFSDLRLAGVGMVGVVHATRTIDAVQRFIGRIELGMIPQIIDTVIHIKNGNIGEVYILKYKVKVPTGMKQEDLSRPVIEIIDFYSGILKFEIYSFGEQIVVVPVEETEKGKSIYKLAEEGIIKEVKRIINGQVKIKFENDKRVIIYVEEGMIPKLIGKEGRTISGLENKLGISIDVQSMNIEKKQISVRIEIENKNVHLIVGKKYRNQLVEIFANNDFLISAKISKDGNIKIRKDTDGGKAIIRAMKNGKDIIIKRDNNNE